MLGSLTGSIAAARAPRSLVSLAARSLPGLASWRASLRGCSTKLNAGNAQWRLLAHDMPDDLNTYPPWRADSRPYSERAPKPQAAPENRLRLG